MRFLPFLPLTASRAETQPRPAWFPASSVETGRDEKLLRKMWVVRWRHELHLRLLCLLSQNGWFTNLWVLGGQWKKGLPRSTIPHFGLPIPSFATWTSRKSGGFPWNFLQKFYLTVWPQLETMRLGGPDVEAGDSDFCSGKLWMGNTFGRTYMISFGANWLRITIFLIYSWALFGQFWINTSVILYL